MIHDEIIVDKDPCFEIDSTTRVIKNMTTNKTTIMQYDHNSERFGFSMPRYVEGHDMMECDKIEVHYRTQGESGIYLVGDVSIDSSDEMKINFSWLLSQNVTSVDGPISFLIRFTCLTDAIIDYVWNTAVFSGISVSAGIYNDAGPIIEEYIDIIEQWKGELRAFVADTETEIEKVDTHISGTNNKHSAKDILCADSLPGDNVQETLDMLFNDVSSKPSSEWAEAVVTNLSNMDERIGALEESMGDIDSALDSIIAIQNELIGGDSV